MVKKRSFWTGLGLGLIAGCLLLQMMLIGSAEPAMSSIEEIDVETLKQQAENLGYRLYESGERWYSNAELAEKVSEAKQDALASVEQNMEPGLERAVYIAPGMSSIQVADLLAKVSLIEDKDLFIQEIKKRKQQGQIQAGVISFKGEPDIAEIIDRLTAK